MQSPRLAASGALVSTCLVLVLSTRARADALPPPEDCPSGKVWVNGHAGGCADEAPTNCAPGWRGVIGGLCAVAVAPEGGQCPAPAVAKPATICLEKRMVHGNGRMQYDPPHERQVPVGIVGPGATCTGADRHESAGSVCLGKDETPFPFVNTGSDARGPRKPETAPGSRSRGCAGGDAGGVTAVGLALVWLGRRMRRARRDLSGDAARR